MNWLWYSLFTILQLATAELTLPHSVFELTSGYRFPDWAVISSYKIKKDTEWLKLISSMICQRKEDSPIYHQNACLSGNPQFKWGHLGMEPDLLQIEGSLETLPETGLWLSFMDLGPKGKVEDTQGPGSEINNFVISSQRIGLPEKPRCLTWQSYKNGSDTLLIMTEDVGKTFGNDSLSYWLGSVTYQPCLYADTNTINLPLDFSKISENQHFLVIKEDNRDGKSEIFTAIRRIVPKIPGIENVWKLCNNSLGIFDRLEGGKEPDYAKNLDRETAQITTIGWGCTRQKWTLIGTTPLNYNRGEEPE